jgi:4'-phosphopantetheinyl transferase
VNAPREPEPLRVYVADARAFDAAQIDALVTPEDRERLARLGRPRRRAEYLAGRALLRFALERSTGRSARSHRLTVRPGGKPECVGGPAISVSHSGALVACATACGGEIGIDVQRRLEGRSTAALAHRHYRAAEIDWLRAAPAGAFYMLWALKEAYLKALGCSLFGGLDRLECRVVPPRIDARADAPAHLALYSVGDAFVGIAITGCTPPRIRIESAPAVSPPIRLIATGASV